MPPFRRVLTLSLAVLLAPGSPWAPGATAATTEWLSGSALETRLRQPVQLTFSEAPLRAAVIKLAQAQQVAVLVDRRVDPGQELNLSLDGVTLEEAMLRIARHKGLGLSRLGPVYYLGPTAAAARLRTVAALCHREVRRLPTAVKRRLLRSSPVHWKDFAEPRMLLAEWSKASELKIIGLERVPHDLWAAADLAPLALVDQLVLLAFQFDLMCQYTPDGSKVQLVPLPADVTLERSYPGGADPAALAERWSKRAPDCRIEVVGRKVVVRGRLEDHERLRSGRSPGRSSTRPTAGKSDDDLARQRFTVTVREQPLARVLKQLGDRLKLQWTLDQESLEQAGISTDRRISFSVREASIDELLEAALDPVGLRFRRQDRNVEIYPVE